MDNCYESKDNNLNLLKKNLKQNINNIRIYLSNTYN